MVLTLPLLVPLVLIQVPMLPRSSLRSKLFGRYQSVNLAVPSGLMLPYALVETVWAMLLVPM